MRKIKSSAHTKAGVYITKYSPFKNCLYGWDEEKSII